MTQEALKMALDALETELSIDWTNNDEFNKSAEKMHEAIKVIKEALAQEQEPVAWMYQEYRDDDQFGWRDEILFVQPPNDPNYFRNIVPLYTTPPQRTEQEPMAWYCCFQGQEEGEFFLFGSPNSERYPSQYKTPLYEHLPQRTWAGLTDVEIDRLLGSTAGENEETHISFARAIEAKLKEVNGYAEENT
jgi:hypothetical protein